ncbi:MAG: hypothetical protein RLZZ58_369, partial [Pseudomonadota bacterium]
MTRLMVVLAVLMLVLAGGVQVAAVPLAGVNQAVIDSDAMPQKLSAFGLFEDSNPAQPRARLAYTLRTPLFSDYAEKRRYASIPVGKQARLLADGRIDFPVGTVLIKSFGSAAHNGGAPIETRLLIHRTGGWVALPYVWDADGRDATLALGGRRIAINMPGDDGATHAIRYAVPNKNQCKECHSLNGAVVPIGPKVANFVVDAALSAPTLAAMFAEPAALQPVMPAWNDRASGTVDARARAYLDVNCAHCHNPAGSASNSGLFLGWTERDPVTYGVGKRPVAAGRGSGGLDFAIAPGQPEQSYLLYRMRSVEAGIAMPEVGRSLEHVE